MKRPPDTGERLTRAPSKGKGLANHPSAIEPEVSRLREPTQRKAVKPMFREVVHATIAA